MRRCSLQPLQPQPRPSLKPVNACSTRNRTNRNNLLKSIHSELINIYFNEQVRKTHIQKVIDSYFDNETIQQPHLKTLPVYPKTISIRRRSILINRKYKEGLSNTSPQPFIMANNPEFTELIKTFPSDQQQALPPIIQTTEDPETNSRGYINLTLSSLMEQEKSDKRSKTLEPPTSIKRKPKLITDNEIYRVSYVHNRQFRLPNSMIKQYKEPCREIYLRQQKTWILLNSLGVKTMWTPIGPLTCEARPFRSLMSKLMQITKESVMNEQVYRIKTKPFYDQLFINDNEVLKSIIKQVCWQLGLVRGKIINNKISLSNIYDDGGSVYISQWGLSAVNQQAINPEFSIMTPILKGYKQWFVTPEHLPPQFLEHVSHESDYDMWELPSAIDIWSLGCMILQILTIVPLWSELRCQIDSRPGLTRRGLFHSKTKQLHRIIAKQKKLSSNIKLRLDKFSEISHQISQKIIQAMMKMLQFDSKKRPTPQQIILMLN